MSQNDDDNENNDDDNENYDDDNENNDAAHLPTGQLVAVSLKLPHKGFIIAVLLFSFYDHL